MRFIEITLGLAAMTGAIIQLTGGEAPGLIMVGLLGLTFLYLLGSFAILNGFDYGKVFKRQTYSDVGSIRVLLAVLIGTFVLPTMTTGVLFALAEWEGAWEMLAVAMVTAPVGIVLAAVHCLAREERRYGAVSRMVIWVSLAGLFFLTTPKASIQELPEDQQTEQSGH